MYSYALFTQNAVEKLIGEPGMQSIDFPLGECFVKSVKMAESKSEFSLDGIRQIFDSDGVLFYGEKNSKTFLVFDFSQCNVIESTSNAELLVIFQKTFRFAVRFWNNQSFTSAEHLFKDKAVIFPFPFSASSSYRLVLERNPHEDRLEKRKIKNSLLVYKYNNESISSEVEEYPSHSIYRRAGECFLKHIPEVVQWFQKKQESKKDYTTNKKSIHIVEMSHMPHSDEFRYLSYDKQIENLTNPQKAIVNEEDVISPIRVEGPAGSGKTAALVLRSIKILRQYTQQGKRIKIAFFTHSKSTEFSVRNLFMRLLGNDVFLLDDENAQSVKIQTLQDYCMQFVNLESTQIIDIDAMEAKQYQLQMVQEAFEKARGKIFNTYSALMSKKARTFFEEEEINKILLLLQYEFGVCIKGISESNLDKYKRIETIRYGLPLENEDDKEFVYRIFQFYQDSLQYQSVYDTDDVTLEALARLNAPLWRRERNTMGLDYLIVDEMHLFNLNEQQVFHFLTKDEGQRKIPICFALDYGQLIGDHGMHPADYLEHTLAAGSKIQQELRTIFRSSRGIVELCASIAASGALLFDGFINPYKINGEYFSTPNKFDQIPELVMYPTDKQLREAVVEHVSNIINTYKCKPCEVAVICFDREMMEQYFQKAIGKYDVNYIDGRGFQGKDDKENQIVVTAPEYVNGLEFTGVILVGVDEGRVPQTGMHDISINFLKYNALNKLYIACSRARYNVVILGTSSRGISSCLKHALDTGVLRQVEG